MDDFSESVAVVIDDDSRGSPMKRTLSCISAFILLVGGGITAFNVQASLLMHLPFDEDSSASWNGSNNEIQDDSGNNAHAHAENGGQYTDSSPAITGLRGTCGYARLDGNDDYLRTQDNGARIQLSGDYSVSFWINANSGQATSTGIYFYTSSDESISHWGLRHNSVEDTLFVEHDAEAFNTNISFGMITGGWHHLVITHSGGTGYAYLDGVLQNSDAISAPSTSNGHLKIGSERTGDSQWTFNGDIDEFRVYDHALNATEINNLLTDQHWCIPPEPPQLLTSYSFEDVVYSGASDEVQDNSSNYPAYSSGSVFVRHANAARNTNPGTCSYAEFNGNSSTRILTSTNNLNSKIMEEYTLAFWIEVDSDTNSATPIRITSSGTDHLLTLQDNENTAQAGDLYIVHDSNSVDDGVNTGIRLNDLDSGWRHVAITLENQTIRSYLDGNLHNTVSYNRYVNPINGQIEIGKSLDGRMDEVRVYNYALTQAQIFNLSTQTVDCPSFVVDYGFEQSTWEGSSGEITNLWGSFFQCTAYNNLTPTASSPINSSDPGTCNYASFDGIDDYMASEDTANALSIDDDYTVMFWVRANTSQYSGASFFGTVNSADSNSYFSMKRDGFSDNVIIEHDETSSSPNKSWDTGINLSQLTSNWNHVAISHHNGKAYSFLNGNFVASGSIDNVSTSSGFLKVGRSCNRSSNAFMRGDVDEFKILRGAASQSLISDHMNSIHPCSAPAYELDHFLVQLGGATASTCAAKSITITACANADCSYVHTNFNGTVNFTTSTIHGNWAEDTSLPLQGTLTTSAADDGTAVYKFHEDDDGVITLLFSNQHADDLTITAEDTATSISSTSGTLHFRDNVFNVVSNPLHSAGQPIGVTSTLYANDGSNCSVVTAYDGTQNIKAWVTRGTDLPVGQAPVLNGVSLPDSEPATANVNVDYVAGVANFNLETADVGQYILNIRDENGFASDGGVARAIDGQTGEVVIKPFGFDISFENDPDVLNFMSVDALGSMFKAAGESFQLTVKAVAWEAADDVDADGIPDVGANLSDNLVLPSFGLETNTETINITHSLMEPSGGNAGVLTGGGAVGGFSSGILDVNLSYDEVGIIDLQAALSDGNYLNTGSDVTGSIAQVGRFVPDHFALTANQVSDACTSGFSYIGQPFFFDFTYEARNRAGTVTQNYGGDFDKLGSASAANFNLTGHHTTPYTDLITRLNLLSWSSSLADGVGTAVANIELQRGATVDGPYQLNIGVAPIDSDGVTLQTFNTDSNNDGLPDRGLVGMSEQRYGRMMVENTVGSELQDAQVPVYAQYYAQLGANKDFIRNSVDSCTSVVTGDIALGQFYNLSNGDTAAALDVWNGHEGIIELTAPGAGSSGSVEISLDVPSWLEFDFKGSGASDPSAIVGFGKYNKDTSTLFLREKFRY